MILKSVNYAVLGISVIILRNVKYRTLTAGYEINDMRDTVK